MLWALVQVTYEEFVPLAVDLVTTMYAKMDAEAEAIAKAKSNISVTIRTLVLEDAEALDCRRLKFEIDVLGLNKGAAAQSAR